MMNQLSNAGEMADCPASGPLVRAVKAWATRCVDVDSVDGMRADVKTNGDELSSGGVSVEMIIPAPKTKWGFGGIEAPSARMTLRVTGATWETQIEIGGTFFVRREELSGDEYLCDMCCVVTGTGKTRGGSISAAARQMYKEYFGTSASGVVKSSMGYAKYFYLMKVVFSGDRSKWASAAKTWQVLQQLQKSLREKALMIEGIRAEQAIAAEELVETMESDEVVQEVAKKNGLDAASRPTKAHLRLAMEATLDLLNAVSHEEVDNIVARVDGPLNADEAAGFKFALSYTGYTPALEEAQVRVAKLTAIREEAARERAEKKRVQDAANAAAAKIALERRAKAAALRRSGRQLRSGLNSSAEVLTVKRGVGRLRPRS